MKTLDAISQLKLMVQTVDFSTIIVYSREISYGATLEKQPRKAD